MTSGPLASRYESFPVLGQNLTVEYVDHDPVLPADT